ncbi:MAG TPA: TolC family protein [Thermoanaerobaculia bacterium]|nr:TolC family protein [Thermoanaerobaculia bacterium]
MLTAVAAPLPSQQATAPVPAAPAGTTPRTLILSLDDALRIAVGESENILVAEAGVMRAMGSESIARSQLFPQVSATASYTRTLRSQFSGIDFGGSPAAPGEPGAPDDGGLSDLPFGQENQYSLGLSVSQLLFDGGQTRARIRAAEAQVRSSEIGSQSALAQTLLDVTQAYFDAQLTDRLVEIAEASLGQQEEILRQTEVARRVGDRSEFELLRARVARDNLLPTLIRQRTQRGEAYLRLKQLLNVPAEDNLQLTTGVEEPVTRLAQLTGTPADIGAEAPLSAPDDRAPVRQAAENVLASEAQFAEARGQRWPTVALSSSFAPVAFPADGIPDFGDFREDWSVTLSLSVPLLTWGRQAGTERVAEGSLSEARARLRQVREAAALDTQVARNDLADAQATLAANTSTSQEARRAFSIAQLQFREGIASQIELADARLLLEQAEVNRALALRDVQVARARLFLLEYLPLNQGFGTGGGTIPQPATPQTQPSQQTVTASTVGSSLGGLGGGSNVVNTGSPIP